MGDKKQYKLSRTLSGHESDVKDVAYLSDGTVCSVSRDLTCRVWNGRESAVVYHATKYLNSVAEGGGYVYAGGLEGSIAVVKSGEVATALLGHEANVCALHWKDGVLASGSWDKTARVWKDNVLRYVLHGHDAAVWGVLVLSADEQLTASADCTIKLWHQGQAVRTFAGHSDVVRGLCPVGNGRFASSSNDGTVRVWDIESGKTVMELAGHTSFVYKVVYNEATGELVSCGEDRSVRVWDRNGKSVQVITLPATSVWSVALQGDDLAIGASDGKVRVFSRDVAQWASEQELQEFAEAVAHSGIGKDQVGEINERDLKDASILNGSGDAEGQVVMIKTPQGVVEAHQWSGGVWLKIGEVVGSSSTGTKKQVYEGKEYDYVFYVDAEEGRPQLALPYNTTENPYDAARRFLEKYELPQSHLEETARFIIKNTESVDLSSGPVEDPYGTRYVPGNAAASSSQTKLRAAQVKLAVVPYTEYVKLATFQAEPILNALRANNDKQPAEKQLSSSDLEEVSSALSNVSASNAGVLIKHSSHMVNSWQPADMLPALDILRIAVAYHPSPPAVAVIQMIFSTLDPGVPKHALLSLRALVNLFSNSEGRKLVKSAQVMQTATDTVQALMAGTPSAPISIAVSSLLLNYAVLFGTNFEQSLSLLDSIAAFTAKSTSPEADYRALLALGTVLANNRMDEVQQSVKNSTMLDWANAKATEDRSRKVLNDINQLV
ncbi:protein Doa1p [Trichomonascus vanleenenianus]|uniref:Doa1p n=1 Tax=Trichomonascus vanleenenianus TaxID=2268995 RepID=UPI003ECB7004